MATTETKVVRDGACLVERMEYARNGGVVYTAYQRVDGPACGFGSIANIGGKWYGQVATASTPASFDVLPAMSEERSRWCRVWRDACYHLAYTLITEAYPEAATGTMDSGHVRA